MTADGSRQTGQYKFRPNTALMEAVEEADRNMHVFRRGLAIRAARRVTAAANRIADETLRDDIARRDKTGEYAGLTDEQLPPMDRPRELLPCEEPTTYRLTLDDGSITFVDKEDDARMLSLHYDAQVEPLYAEPVELSRSIRDVLTERQRQIAEGCHTTHDDARTEGEIGEASIALLMAAGGNFIDARNVWPWTRPAPSKSDDRRWLHIQGLACGLAELERLDRAGWPTEQDDDG